MSAKKQTEKHAHREGQGAAGPSHLDVKLTEVASKTAERLKRWRLPITLALVAIVVAGAGYTLVGFLAESQAKDLEERHYRLLGVPAAKKEGYSLDKAEVEKLLADARGAQAEGYILKSLTEFYLEQAEK
ncbi:MAG: hypothetical protein HY721_22145, partial [Planctomycetes bacterium]|nr:hypothetical protein [Planctomycetota bacterium]